MGKKTPPKDQFKWRLGKILSFYELFQCCAHSRILADRKKSDLLFIQTPEETGIWPCLSPVSPFASFGNLGSAQCYLSNNAPMSAPRLGIHVAFLWIGKNGELILKRNELFWGQISTQIKLTISLEIGPRSPQPKCSTGAIHSPQSLLNAAGHFLWMNLGLQWFSSRTGKRRFDEETWTHGGPGEHMRMQRWRDEVSGWSSRWIWAWPTWRAVSEPCQGCMVFLINYNTKQNPGCQERSLPGPA